MWTKCPIWLSELFWGRPYSSLLRAGPFPASVVIGIALAIIMESSLWFAAISAGGFLITTFGIFVVPAPERPQQPVQIF